MYSGTLDIYIYHLYSNTLIPMSMTDNKKEALASALAMIEKQF